MNKTKQVFQGHMLPMIVKFVVALILYSPIWVNNLVNRQDGIWNGSLWHTGNIELSSGRWATRYVDDFFRGLSVNPIMSVLAILLFIIGIEIIIDIFEVRSGSLWDYIVSFLFIGNAFISASLSYLFFVKFYALSFVLAMFAVRMLLIISEDVEKKKKLTCLFKAIIPSVCIALLMGLYQAYIECVTVAIVFLIICTIKKNKDDLYKMWKKIGILIGTSAIAGMLGFVLYELVLKFDLHRYAVRLSDYNGINEINIGTIIDNLGNGIERTYKDVFAYFLNDSFLWNVLDTRIIVIFIVFLVLMLILNCCTGINEVKKTVSVLFTTVFFIGIIPLAARVTVILAPDSGFDIWQSASSALILPLMLAILISGNSMNEIIPNIKPKESKIIIGIMIFFSAFIIWGSASQTVVDMEVMKEETDAAEQFVGLVVDRLIDDGYYDVDKKYAFVGIPKNNPLVYRSSIVSDANSYTWVSGPYWDERLASWTLRSLCWQRLRIYLPWCNDAEFADVLKIDEIENMGVFPVDDSIRIFDDTVVVKISE